MLSPNNNPLYLFIEAQDGLVHEEYVQFQLIIVIEDMNDNHPRITANLQSSYTVPEVSNIFNNNIIMKTHDIVHYRIHWVG